MNDFRTYPGVAGLFYGQPLALMPEKMKEIDAFLRGWMAGNRISAEELEQRYAAAQQRQASTARGVAVIPLYGVISQRMNMIAAYSGGTSTELLSKAFRTAVNTPDVGTIVFDIDSPGGSTSGIAEVAEEIFKARGQKKMIAVSNTLMASAAYWIGSAADEIVVSPSSATGSIGVYTVHVDFSKQNEMLGVNPTYITAGKYKAETNEDQPLSSEAEAYLQSIVDDYYSLFAGAVAKHRSVNKSDVANGFGQGRVVTAKKAVELGMADRVATLSQVLEKLGVGLQTNGRNLAVERKRIALA